MSIGCDFGESSFYHESAHRSRKQRKCIETFRVIEPGEMYVSCRGVSDGEFWSEPQSLKAYHLCRALHTLYRVETGQSECVIPFGGLPEVELYDITDYFNITDYHKDGFMIRALKWANVLGPTWEQGDDGDEFLIHDVSDEDWERVTSLSVLLWPAPVPFDAIGRPLKVEVPA